MGRRRFGGANRKAVRLHTHPRRELAAPPALDDFPLGIDGALDGGADTLAMLKSVDAVVYDWDIETDALSWSANVDATLAGFESTTLATGAGFAACITPQSESSRFHAVHHGTTRDEGQGVAFRVGYRLASPDGRFHDVEDFGRWFADGSGRPRRVHGVLRVLGRMPSAPRDPGASLGPAVEDPFCSRRAFNEMVDELCGATPTTARQFAVLVVGFDDLAAINRRDGFDAADELIAAAGLRLATCLRAGDKIARHAGGKFAILISLANGDHLSTAVRRLARSVNADPLATSTGKVRAAARIGAVLAPRNGRNAHLLLQRADEALEIAAESPDRHAVYTPDVAAGESRRREMRVADEIVAALSERRVVMAFQPVVPTIAGRVGFKEALLRVRQSDGSLAGPAGLLPVAEKLGLIEQIDLRVLELTLERLAAAPDERLSMNISVATLRSPYWLDRFKAGLRNAPGAAHRLIVEIIETQPVGDIEDAARLFRAMRGLGARIAMDDFGAGHTSFRNLRGLGVDIVKIDGAFVQNISRSPDDRFFVRTLAALARHLEIETVAEWVEDGEAARMLAEWGVDYLQGHFLGRPETAEAPEDTIALSRVEA